MKNFFKRKTKLRAYGHYLITNCCEMGPITYENYCPNCGKLIQKDKVIQEYEYDTSV